MSLMLYTKTGTKLNLDKVGRPRVVLLLVCLAKVPITTITVKEIRSVARLFCNMYQKSERSESNMNRT